jgi:hypothetical protein
MYTDFANLVGIPDYDPEYEAELAQMGNSYKLPYGGELNRSQGRYTMDITAYIQRMWNEYLKAEGDITKIQYRSIFVAPAVAEMFTLGQVAMRGDEAIPVVLTYTLMR